MTEEKNKEIPLLTMDQRLERIESLLDIKRQINERIDDVTDILYRGHGYKRLPFYLGEAEESLRLFAATLGKMKKAEEERQGRDGM